MDDDWLVEQLREAIRERAKRPPAEQFADMVRRGVIDGAGARSDPAAPTADGGEAPSEEEAAREIGFPLWSAATCRRSEFGRLPKKSGDKSPRSRAPCGPSHQNAPMKNVNSRVWSSGPLTIG